MPITPRNLSPCQQEHNIRQVLIDIDLRGWRPEAISDIADIMKGVAESMQIYHSMSSEIDWKGGLKYEELDTNL